MRSPLSRIATPIVVGLLLVACVSATSPAPTSSPPPTSSSPTTTPPPVAPSTPPAGSPATPAPSGGPIDPLLNAVVVTVSDRIRVRSEPRVSDDSIMYEPVLPLGTELTVLDGPVSASHAEGGGRLRYIARKL